MNAIIVLCKEKAGKMTNKQEEDKAEEPEEEEPVPADAMPWQQY